MLNTHKSPGAEMERLCAQYARGRDPALRERIIAGHLNIAAALAARYNGRGVEYDDLYQVASLALVKALDRFDPEKGVKFSTFATPTMIGEIKNYFRDRSRSIRLPRNSGAMLAALEKCVDELMQEMHRDPTAEELARRMGLGVEQILEQLEMRGAVRPVSLDYTSQEGENDAPMEAFLGFEEKGYSEFENNETIQSALAELDGQERELIQMRYFEGLSQRQAAERMGVSQMSVSRMERRALSKMRGQMEGTDGGTSS